MYQKPNPEDSPYLGGPGEGGGKPRMEAGKPYTKPAPNMGVKPPMSTPPGGGMGPAQEPPWMAAARQQMAARRSGTWNPRVSGGASMAPPRRQRPMPGYGQEMGMKPPEPQGMPQPGMSGGGFDPMEYLRSYLTGVPYNPGGPTIMGGPNKPFDMGQGRPFPNQIPPGGFMQPPDGMFSTPYLGGPGGGMVPITGGGLMAGAPPQQSMMNPAILPRLPGRR